MCFKLNIINLFIIIYQFLLFGHFIWLPVPLVNLLNVLDMFENIPPAVFC